MSDLPHDDDEAALDLLRDWLRRARSEAEADAPGVDSPRTGPLPIGLEDGVGLYRLVEEFTALRHEVKLQTRGARDLRDQAEAMLPELRRAIEQFRSVEPKEQQAAFSAARPLLEALADLDEALDRGRTELEKARPRLVGEPATALESAIVEHFRGRPWLSRLRHRSYHEEVLALVRRRDSWLRPDLFDALIQGYALIQNRLQRALQAEQLLRIETVGRPADPSRMTVVELVDAPGHPPGVVVDEVRRGYSWRGRVLRFAEVRATRPAPATDFDLDLDTNYDSGDSQTFRQ
jgi:molecular chaperone GrpE